MRGVILSAVGPATSALNNWTPPKPRSGSIARLKTIIPIPPIKCVKLRQNNKPSGISLRLFIILEPVVVRPDIDSKNDSVYV